LGDPKRQRKKYSKPSHPWEAERLKEELVLVGQYGLRNKRELWKHQTTLRRYRRRARNIRIMTEDRQKKETELLIKKLHRLGLLPENATIDDVLRLSIHDLLERRLQTIVYKKGLARTPYQARQFIVHGHIAISGRRVTTPGRIITIEEEPNITYSPNSPINKNPDHPARIKTAVS